MVSFSEYFGLVFATFCLIYQPLQTSSSDTGASRFEVIHQWRYINFTWASEEDYTNAISSGGYIAENVAMAGIKIYGEYLYIALPKIRSGSPVTLARVQLDGNGVDELLEPYPSWDMNTGDSCDTLQSVQSMEIDAEGVMWVIDGFRLNNLSNCPAKLLLLDLKDNGKILHKYEFPEDISSSEEGFLNDIVIDDSGDEKFAYITECSKTDPGLIVYSLCKDKSWKLRDASMLPEAIAANFTVGGYTFSDLLPIDGIALSPKSNYRTVYYSALTSYSLYALNTSVLKNENSDDWKTEIQFIGTKQSQTDGMIIDNKGNLYYTLLDLYGVGVWNTSTNFSESRILDKDVQTFIWPDSFAFDGKGWIYVLADSINQFLDESIQLGITEEPKFRVLGLKTGTSTMVAFCEYFGYFFTAYCFNQLQLFDPEPARFEIRHQWRYINFTWPSQQIYSQASSSGKYIPENVAMAGIKIYGDELYIALPRIREGTPVTLAKTKLDGNGVDELLEPYPSWEMNVGSSCETLQSVQSMEVDARGYMWVLDGFRVNNLTSCPPKLVLLDLNGNGRILHTYEFPEEISSANGGFLNDIVVDDSGNETFAYITENSGKDPGLIVYSLKKNKSWKFRDASMFPELFAADFEVGGFPFSGLVPIDGIALSPKSREPERGRIVFYSALTGFSLYAINTSVLQNEEISNGGDWRREVRYVGRKQSQTDGMAMDNVGNLFYTLLGSYGVGVWNIYDSFDRSKILDKDVNTFVWPDSFAFDGKGWLYVLADSINQFFDPTVNLQITGEAKFRVMGFYTGTTSYLY